ncbi:ABC transporter ATP-binding protein [Methylobacterium currus]|uniref:ABC transporter ATP-binding protein n=1 Tax=Methylobacterium currus TaxID=2051553 RepID=A0A2R4WDB5_9HYPH|nr:ABC transporter ATP-binding protein [Methylobacterium currus]AWB19534.1 ABC transporter ATP-binding protein [Methylobacterium currus]UHC16389.1 ABC transporter ATP-binding protein [Methylobacterium currus]
MTATATLRKPEPAAAAPGAAEIAIDRASKVFGTGEGAVVALEDVTVSIPSGQFVCLLGPSGCGKSTLLNAIAGFSPLSRGEIRMNGRPVVDPGPDRGMVFQEYALFPWMTVEQNIRFGLDIKGMARPEADAVVARIAATLGLSDFLGRFPKELSGGMRQRVAIARILALDPPVMLMDEPFGALDALTRRTLQDELLRIWAEYRKTIVFVTHSIEEAIYLADRIVVLTYRPGRMKRDLIVPLARPRDTASAEFNALKRELAGLVMEEQQRFTQAELHGSAVD